MSQEIRCPKCSRLLAKITDGQVHIGLKTGSKTEQGFVRQNVFIYGGYVSVTCPKVFVENKKIKRVCGELVQVTNEMAEAI